MPNDPSFIPDAEFTPDSTAPTDTQAPAFIPDDQFKSDEDVRESKYGTTGQQLKTGLEGAATAATFGLSTGLEKKLLDVQDEDINARRETNPGSYGLGQVAGLAGSLAIPGLGEANVLAHAGEGAVALAGLRGATGLARIGSAALKGAVETALVSSGDEVSKMLSNDPNQTAQSAMTSIGLSSVLGGALGAGFGVASPLWKSVLGDKLGNVLDTLASRGNGIEGQVPTDIESILAKAGITDAPPEIRAALGNDPRALQMAKTLEQSDTTSAGRNFQQSLTGFKRDLGDNIVRNLGADPADLASNQLSRYESGREIGETLAKEFDQRISPLSAEYEAIKDKFGKVLLPQDAVSGMADKIGHLVQEQGWYASPSSDIMKEVNRVLTELPNARTMQDLGHYTQAVGNNMQADPLNKSLSRAGGMIKSILSDGEYQSLSNAVGEKEGQEAAMRLANVREAYAKQATLKDAIDDRLHIRGSVSGYAKNLQEMASTEGEKLLNRISGTRDADLLNTLTEHFPETAQAVRQYHVDTLLDSAARRAKPGENISIGALKNSLGKMSPELRNFAIRPEQLEKVEAAGHVWEQFNRLPHNFSNTARTNDRLMAHLPGTAMGMLSMLTGHNPVVGMVVGAVTKPLAKDIPDADRLSLLKFLGSSKPINAEGFKGMAEYIAKAAKGIQAVNKATGAVFDASKDVVGTIPSKIETEKLQDRVDQLSQNPDKLMDVGGQLGHYLPEHQTALAQTAQAAITYLTAQKPATAQNSPLDRPIPPSAAQKAAYTRTLQIAEQPLMVLQHIADGTLQPKDVQDLNALYPGMPGQLAQKLTGQMIEHLADGGKVSYRLRTGLSLLTGQPIDTTMTPAAIQSAQATYAPAQPPQAPPKASKTKSDTSKLGKTVELAETPAEKRQAALSKA